jgi:hypothetical protein
MRALALLVTVTACGRFGFGHGELRDDARDNDGAATGDVLLIDGAETDGAMADAGPSCVGFDVCDGFETATFQTFWMPDSMVTVDTTRAHRGTRSAHIRSPAIAANDSSYQQLVQTKTFLNNPTTIWIRGWYWLSAVPANGNGAELMSAERPGVNGDYVFMFSNATHIYSQFASNSQISSTAVPVGQWFCMVFKIVRSTGSAGSLDLTGDVPALSMPNAQTDSSTGAVNTITMGIGFADSNVTNNQPAIDLWIDDVIVHSSAVTCAD